MKIERIIIDACVFLKLFLNEKDSDLALDLFKKINQEEIEILVPKLFLYEFISGCVFHNISFTKANEILTEYQKANLSLITESNNLFEKAEEITKKGKENLVSPSLYDSIYHALAMENDCFFVTSDKKHYDKTEHLGNIKLLKDLVLS